MKSDSVAQAGIDVGDWLTPASVRITDISHKSQTRFGSRHADVFIRAFAPQPSTQGKIQRHRRVHTNPKTVVSVEHTGLIVFCIDQKCIDAHMLAGLQAAVNGQSQKHRPYSTATVFDASRQAAHAKAGYRVTRQLFFLGITKLVRTNLRRAQGVETQNFAGAGVINQKEYRAQPFGTLLHGIFAQILVKCRLTTLEAGSVVKPGIQCVLFKQA